MIKVVIDTNVLVSALLKSQRNPALILSLILQHQLTLCVSEEIFTEYGEVLHYGKFKQLDQDLIKKLLDDIQRDALWINPKVSVDIIKDHPPDNRFLECALEAKVDFIVTGNKKHFNFKSFHHIPIVAPTDFLFIVAKRLFNPLQG